MDDKRDEPSAKDIDRKLHASLSRLAAEAAQQAPVLGASPDREEWYTGEVCDGTTHIYAEREHTCDEDAGCDCDGPEPIARYVPVAVAEMICAYRASAVRNGDPRPVEWRAVTESEPSQGVHVLFLCAGVVEDGYRNAQGWWALPGWHRESVTHWMPLPSAPHERLSGAPAPAPATPAAPVDVAVVIPPHWTPQQAYQCGKDQIEMTTVARLTAERNEAIRILGANLTGWGLVDRARCARRSIDSSVARADKAEAERDEARARLASLEAATQGPLDREALGRLAWSERWHPGHPAGLDFDRIDPEARESWCRAAAAVVAAVKGKAQPPRPVDRLSLIADLVSGLPHGDAPGLELGHSVEGHALIRQMVLDGAQGMSSEHMDSNGIDYACVRINGLWIGASKPKTEGK